MANNDASLHSPDATKRMIKFRIGKVDAPWLNFTPPIQGGIFHSGPKARNATVVPSADQREQLAEDAKLKQRSAPETVTAKSESIDNSVASELDADGMSYLDAISREYITLDLEKYPNPDISTQATVVEKYRKLYERMEEEGLMNPNWQAYAADCYRYFALLGLFIVFLHFGQWALSGFFLGLLWHQLVFTAHDAGHIGITHNYHFDSILGIIIADYIGGLSLGWWKSNHNVHHIVTNAPEHDPDIEHMPLFAISHRFLGNLYSTYYDRAMKYDIFARFLLRFQTWTYYPLLSLGRFNLYALSWQYLFGGKAPKKGVSAWHRWVEIGGQFFFWFWFGYLVVYRTIPDGWSRFTFVMVSHITSSPLHVQIVLSHFAMSTADLGPQESFPQRMLRTTMDVDCPPWLDFIHGGLQFQAIHHLFPRMPRHNLRQAQKLVLEFCEDVGIPYAYYGFAHGNQQVIGRLGEVSRQAAILAKCQKSIAKSGRLDGHHH